jgi:putative peptidoglycan lipid II flippase
MQSTTKTETSPQTRSNVTKTVGLVALLTVVSKLAGFGRDVIVNWVFGTSAVADAYNYAYLFTGNVLVLFGGLGGPFHSATVSVLTREKDKPEAGLLMGQVTAVTAVLTTTIAVAFFTLAPYLVQLNAGGYAKEDPVAHATFIQQTVEQLRWMSPLILISGLIGIAYGVLNVFERIFWPSLSPLLASVAIICGVLLFENPHAPTALPLSLATLVGAIAQLLVQMPDLAKCKLPWKLSFVPAPMLKDYLFMLGPACFGTLVGQLTVYVDASFTGQMQGQGDWTAIVNSNRLVQLPLGILATAMLVPMLPRFAELAHKADDAGIKHDYKKAFQLLIFLSMPLAALFIALPEPIVAVLFKRGNFNVHSVNLVGEALWWLAPSIMVYLGRDLITRVFYAYKDSRTPFMVACIAIAAKYALDWFFITRCHWSVGGISLATSFITVLNLGLLTYFLRKRVGRLGTTSMLKPVTIMVVAGIICGALSGIAFLGWERTCAFALGPDKHIVHAESASERFALRDFRISMIELPEDSDGPDAASHEQTSETKKDAQAKSQNSSPTASQSASPTSPPGATISKQPREHFLSLALGLCLSAGLGIFAYLAICLAGRLDELDMVRRRLLRRA